jgi:hypothetical protein
MGLADARVSGSKVRSPSRRVDARLAHLGDCRILVSVINLLQRHPNREDERSDDAGEYPWISGPFPAFHRTVNFGALTGMLLADAGRIVW